MKRKIFSIMAIAAIALTSCNKDKPATSELGEATVNGNVWADLDQSDDFQSGLYIPELNPEGVEGMQVSIEVNTANWVQNQVSGYDYEVKTYSATTDAEGNWSITLPATEDAFSVSVNYNDVYSTRTVIEQGGSASLTENVRLSFGSQSATIFSGAVVNLQAEAAITNVGANANNYGSGRVFGEIYANWDNGLNSTSFYELCDASSPLAGATLSWAFYDAPYGQGAGVWAEITIAADGSYEIVFTTEGSGLGQVGIEYGFYDFIANQIIPNQANTSDSTASSIYSIGGVDGYSEGGFEAGEIRQQDLYINVTNI
jgi:hypothetical protein